MKNLYYLSLFLVCVACGPKAPTDEQLKDLCRNAAFAMAEQPEEAGKDKAFHEVVDKSTGEYDINKITPGQIDLMFHEGGVLLDSRLRTWLAPVLEEKTKKEGMEGVESTYYRWKYFPVNIGISKNKESERVAYKAILVHPLMKDYLGGNENALTDVVKGAARVTGDGWVNLGITENVKSLLGFTLPDDAIFASMGVFNTAFTADKLAAADKNEIRQKVLQQYKSLLNKERYAKGKRRATVESGIQYLQGPYATETLVGNKAPGLDFIWISGGKEKNMDDFKGKVVVLDFWATKCAPCLTIMPNMRELQKRYKGYPVEIVGVTSIMGYHVDVKNGRTIQTAGKPEYEIELMQTFMKDQKMNWRVAFARQDVMNLDYGVLSIPHIAIIDAAGKVRYNGLDPFTAPCQKADKIDALLKEAGLRCPAKPMEKVDYREKHKAE